MTTKVRQHSRRTNIVSGAMADAVDACNSAGDGSSLTTLTQCYEEDVDLNGRVETPVDLADDDTEGRKSTAHAAARRISTKWSPNIKPVLARAGTSPFGGHFINILATA